MFPIIPFLALLGLVGSGATLAWYNSLPKEEQDEANKLTSQYASELFGKTVKDLTKAEAGRVHSLVQKHFVN